MGWLIKCPDTSCGNTTWAANIVDLISNHRDGNGWFLCQCGRRGFIEKSFPLQERGEVWEPYLRGIIPLGTAGDTYQPFVFLVSYAPDGEVNDVWFSYYKDLRPAGRLKLGYGPGGPPVLGKSTLLELLSQLVKLGYCTQAEIHTAIGHDALSPSSR
jgi:hypothetical protein